MMIRKTEEMDQRDQTMQRSNREHKSTVFTSYFGIAENAASLYNGLNCETHVQPEDIVFETLEGVLYMARKNDLAFTAKQKILVIGEHQSTVNFNMPIRSAIYYGRTMEKIIPPKQIYRTRKIAIPTPEFYVSYNGRTPQPAEQMLHLSDSYLESTNNPMLELKVKVININLSANHPILQKCHALYEYSSFIQKIYDYIKLGNNRDIAIACAMEECVHNGVMADFINQHGSEVRNMLFEEFNLEDAKQEWYAEWYAEGMEAGIERGIERGMERGIRQGVVQGFIKACRDLDIAREEVLARVRNKFQMSEREAEDVVEKFWK